jgi:hypothetical protein
MTGSHRKIDSADRVFWAGPGRCGGHNGCACRHARMSKGVGNLANQLVGKLNVAAVQLLHTYTPSVSGLPALMPTGTEKNLERKGAS